MSYKISFTKLILNTGKFSEEIRELPLSKSLYQYFNIKDNLVDVFYSANLNQDQINEVTSYINNFVEVSVQDQMEEYLAKDIEVFIKDLLLQFRAENILMGISQSNKTAEVQGLFEQQILLPNRTRPVSLKGTLDSASLTVTLEVFRYLISNPGLYSDLSPFITAGRLTNYYNKIATKLGAPTI